MSFMKMLSLEIPRWVEGRVEMIDARYIEGFQAAIFRVFVQFTTDLGEDYKAKFAREVGVLNVCMRRPLVAQALADAGYGIEVQRHSIKRLSAIIKHNTKQAELEAEMPPRVDLSHLELIKGWDDLELEFDELSDDEAEDMWPELRPHIVFDADLFNADLDRLVDELRF